MPCRTVGRYTVDTHIVDCRCMLRLRPCCTSHLAVKSTRIVVRLSDPALCLECWPWLHVTTISYVNEQAANQARSTDVVNLLNILVLVLQAAPFYASTTRTSVPTQFWCPLAVYGCSAVFSTPGCTRSWKSLPRFFHTCNTANLPVPYFGPSKSLACHIL